MLAFCIDARLLGTSRHLLCSERTQWVDNVPSDVWHISGTIKNSNNWCLDTLFQLEDVKLDLTLDAPYRKMITTVSSGSLDIPFSLMLPKHCYTSFIQKIRSKIEDILPNINKDYHTNTWRPCTALFDSLQKAYVDVEKWKECILDNEGNKREIVTFKPSLDGSIDVPTYNRLGTRTGRLTVTSGPRILTLKKSTRSMLQSQWSDGSIMMYDFSALETRIVMYEAGLRDPRPDVYQHLCSLFDDKFERSIIKKVVIAEMYGRSLQNLSEELSMLPTDVAPIVKKIRNYLGISSLQSRVKQNYIDNGFIRNRYNRKVLIEDPQEHILLNSYVQSTGVDVSLLGFNELLKYLIPLGCRPLYLLHDAIVIDVPHGVQLETIKWIKVPGYIQKFPVKLETIK